VNHAPALARFVAFFEKLDPAALECLGDIFAEEVRFQDPFNEVVGIKAVRQVFAHGLASCPGMRFEVFEAVPTMSRGEPVALLRWRMDCQDKKGLVINGTSYIRFNPDGRVAEHIDYWDPAGQLYERVPVLGSLMRWLRRRISATAL